MRPRKRIKLFATLPHAHATVTRIRTTLVRNGVEVNEIIDADNFNMNHQVKIFAYQEHFRGISKSHSTVHL